MSSPSTVWRRLAVAGPGAIAALAFLAIAEASDVSPHASPSAPAAASRDRSDPRMDGPSPSPAFIVQEPVRLGPALPGVAASAASSPADAFRASVLSPGGERLFVLVNARIQEKYRPFQDSLRTP